MIIDRLVERSRRHERTLVDDHRGARRLMRREFALFLIVLSALFWREQSDGGWLDVAGALLVALFVGWGALAGTRRALSYRNGWLDGRAQMVGALTEAVHRGIPATDWLRGELERDYSVLGVRTIVLADEEEGEQ